jgi:hypothetical protein
VIRIIDNKKIEMTNDEWNMFEDICHSYTTSSFRGEDLFTELFETDEDGVIIFLKPPREKRTTLEAWLFMAAVYQHQHIRILYHHVDSKIKEMNVALAEVKQLKTDILHTQSK